MFCQKCGHSLSDDAKFCTKCGSSVGSIPTQAPVQQVIKKPSKIVIIGGGFIAICIALGIVGALVSPSKTEPGLPGGEATFISAIKSYEDSFSDAGDNEVKQDQIRKQRGDAVSRIMRQRKVDGWIGTVEEITTSQDGNAAFKVSLGSDIYVETNNNMVSDGLEAAIDPNLGPNMIKENSDLYKVLLGLKTGDKVQFSGSFYPDKKDYIEESSLTTSGSMQEPEFIFKFNVVRAVAQN